MSDQRVIDRKREWRANNPDRHHDQRRRRRAKHPDLYLAQQARYRAKYRDRVREKAKATRRTVIDMYGGKCACCGETEYVFLALDHIHGGGRQHRSVKGSKIHFELLRTPLRLDLYRVLCHNCNYAMYATKGACPHRASYFVGEGDAAWA